MKHSDLTELEQVAQHKKDVLAQNAGKRNENLAVLQRRLRVF